MPDDLREIDAALRRLKPELSEDRATLLGARARTRARASLFAQRANYKEPFLRSRLAITFMLVLGFAFSGAGVGMAVTGVGTDGTSAADVQYPTEQPPLQGNTEEDLGGGPVVGGVTDEGDEGPADVADEVDDVQETRQLGVEEGGEELPFTGFAAIPVLLLGMALLTAGLVLRRRGSGAGSA